MSAPDDEAPGPGSAAATAGTEAPAATPAAEIDQLRAAVQCFRDGDFGGARRALGRVDRAALAPELGSQAEELERRLSADPVAIWIAVGSAALFLLIIYLTYFR